MTTEKICFRYDGSEEAKQALYTLCKKVNCFIDPPFDGCLYYPKRSDGFHFDRNRDPSYRLVPPAEFLRLMKGESEPKWKVGDECFYRGYRSKIIHIHDGMAWIFDIDQPSDDKTENNIIVELHELRPVRKSLREEVCKLIAENKGPLETVADRILELVKERKEEL